MDTNARHDTEIPHRTVATALGVAAASLLLNFVTMSPGVHWYDSAEFAAKAIHLDIPHPPGYPLYIVVAHLFTWLPFEPAYSLSLLSALSAAAAAFLLTLAAFEFGVRPVAAATGGLLLCASFTFWDNTNVAESYGPGLAFAAAVFWLLLRALRLNRPELSVVAALVAGVGTGAHLFITTLGLGFVALVWFAGGTQTEERLRTLTRCSLGAGAAIGFTYLLIPLSQPERLGDLEHWRWSWMMMSGGTFWSYFDRPTPDYPLLRAGRMLAAEISLAGVALVVAGFVWLKRNRPFVAIAFALAIVGNVGFFLEFEAHDLEVFYLPSVLVLCLVAAAGVEGIATLATALSRGATDRVASFAAIVCLAVPLGVAAQNAERVDKRDDTSAHDFGMRLVETLPEHSVFITFNTPDEWRLQSVWLYFHHGLGHRQDVRTLSDVSLQTLLCYIDSGHPAFAFVRHPDLIRTQFLFEEVEGTELLRLRRSPAQGLLSPPTDYVPGGAPPVCR
ncbi:MAG: DUF2723 domain-containing protein [Myxococcota bacterium]|nr:DUF2723 domain-containing protein [Myxococcota bacterium]